MGTNTRMPSIFISHGAPTLAVSDGPSHRFLQNFGRQIGKPRAVVVLSAHFLAPVTTVTAADRPETIHDFGGFPRELYELSYPAPGDGLLAADIADRLTAAGIPAQLSPSRGFDHGAWVPMILMYPEADVPMIQVSLNPPLGAEFHYRLGAALEPLRDTGILIMGSGGATHNLRELSWQASETGPPDWADAFNEWLADAITAGRRDDLLAYRERGPYAPKNHPTEEHFFPLLCALGAGSGEQSRHRVHHSYTYGALSMDVYRFG